jgi:hypothetical protein
VIDIGRQTEIILLYMEASSLTSNGSLGKSLAASVEWVDFSLRIHHPSTLDAYRTSLNLLEIFMARSSSLETRFISLPAELTLRTQTLSMDGAACALDSSRVDLAVELLEQGRTVLLTQAGKYRTPVHRLSVVAPDLAEEFQRLSWQMSASIMSEGNPSDLSDSSGPRSRDIIGK